MHRIVINIDRAQDSEADEILADIRERVFDGDIEAWAARVYSPETTDEERKVREAVWHASQSKSGLTLHPEQVAALWRSILNDAHKVSAFRAP